MAPFGSEAAALGTCGKLGLIRSGLLAALALDWLCGIVAMCRSMSFSCAPCANEDVAITIRVSHEIPQNVVLVGNKVPPLMRAQRTDKDHSRCAM